MKMHHFLFSIVHGSFVADGVTIQNLGELLQGKLLVLWHNKRKKRLSDEFFCAVAHEILCGFVKMQKVPFQIIGNHCINVVLKQRPVALFTLQQLNLHVFSFRDIFGDAKDFHDFPFDDDRDGGNIKISHIASFSYGAKLHLGHLFFKNFSEILIDQSMVQFVNHFKIMKSNNFFLGSFKILRSSKVHLPKISSGIDEVADVWALFKKCIILQMDFIQFLKKPVLLSFVFQQK